MQYTQEERIERLLDAFSVLVRQSEYFDILFSEKLGYIQVYVKDKYGDAIYSVLEDYEHVARALFDEVIDDVRDLQLCGQHDEIDLYPAEEAEATRRIETYISALGEDKETCRRIWNEMLAGLSRGEKTETE